MRPKRPSSPADEWQLPSEPYLPGRSPRPDEDDDVHRIGRAAPVTDPALWQSNVAWLAGIRLYREGYFWEAHEVWEKVWMKARPNSRERLLVQGLIQLANSALKQRMGQHRAAVRLAKLALALTEGAAIGGELELMGVDLQALNRRTRAYAEQLPTTIEAPHPPLQVNA
jgi:predicted metal-dependent hydrolase